MNARASVSNPSHASDSRPGRIVRHLPPARNVATWCVPTTGPWCCICSVPLCRRSLDRLADQRERHRVYADDILGLVHPRQRRLDPNARPAITRTGSRTSIAPSGAVPSTGASANVTIQSSSKQRTATDFRLRYFTRNPIFACVCVSPYAPSRPSFGACGTGAAGLDRRCVPRGLRRSSVEYAQCAFSSSLATREPSRSPCHAALFHGLLVSWNRSACNLQLANDPGVSGPEVPSNSFANHCDGPLVQSAPVSSHLQQSAANAC